jgi:RNA 2',3'-cyclic 3'-phosphodiesterase
VRAQHSCFGFEGPRTDGLFLGLFPDPETAARLSANAQQLCIRHRLSARLLAPQRMHISLLGFGRYSSLPPQLVATIGEAAATIIARPFDVVFDRAMSFLGEPRPLVLCGGEGVKELMTFRGLLGSAVQKSGLGRVRSQYTPHVTLLYHDRGIEEHAIEPVRWTVREFVLVHSLLGQSRYIPCGRWQLRGG